MIYENIDDFINDNNDHLVSFTVSTNNNLNLIQNLFESAKNNNIKLVLFALDKHICTFMNKLFDIDIVMFMADENPHKDKEFYNYEFGSSEWKQIVYYRYFIAHRLLKEGKNIVYMDTDVYINRNYMVDIREQLRKNDLIIQTNGNSCCTGFFAIKSCRKLINFFSKRNMTELKYEDYGGTGGSSDQKFFNHFIGNNMEKYNCAMLDRKFYPNGNYFYDNYDMINDYCYIVHFNCVQGEFKKIKRVIKYNKLLIDLIDYLPKDELEDPEVLRYRSLLNEIKSNKSKSK